MLVSCATDVKLHEYPSYELAHIYRPAGTSGHIRNVSWCKDGSWLTVVPSQGNAEIIRTKDDVHLLQSILGVAQPITAVFMRTTKKNIVMSTMNGGILVYDIKARGIKKKFTNSGSTVNLLDWNLKDTHLAAGSADGQVTLYSNTTNQKSSVFKVPSSKSVSAVRFHRSQRNILASASDEGVVVLWDINAGKRKCHMESHQAPVTDIAFSTQNHNLMTSVGLDRQLQCYDINSDDVALTVLADHPLSAVDIAPDGHTVAVGSSRGVIYIYDLRDHVKPLKVIPAHSGEIKRVLYQPSSSTSRESVNITEDKPVKIEMDQTRHSSSVDSFAQMLNGINEFSPQIDMELESDSVKKESAAGDSFFAELGTLDPIRRQTGSFTRDKCELSNFAIGDGIKKWSDSKTNHSQLDGSGQISNNKDIIPTVCIKPASSTPRQGQTSRVSFVQNQELPNSNISPIMVMGCNQQIAHEDFTKTVKHIVTQVVSEQISDLTDCLNRQFLNLQWSFSKQFVSQEEYFERLLAAANGTSNSNMSARVQQLQQENEFLKSKINELLEKCKN
ncbi:Grip71 [Carabus blaptoides fortunei]